MKSVGKLFGMSSPAPPPDNTGALLAKQESQAQAERVRLATEQAARLRAARRGGIRALLSSERANPESGLQTTLGSAL